MDGNLPPLERQRAQLDVLARIIASERARWEISDALGATEARGRGRRWLARWLFGRTDARRTAALRMLGAAGGDRVKAEGLLVNAMSGDLDYRREIAEKAYRDMKTLREAGFQ